MGGMWFAKGPIIKSPLSVEMSNPWHQFPSALDSVY